MYLKTVLAQELHEELAFLTPESPHPLQDRGSSNYE